MDKSIDTPRMQVSEIGERIEVEKIIGSGAMALLLRGKMRATGRDVAVKVLLPKHMSNPEIAERFIREGEALAELKSPYLPEVLALGTTESDQPYIVMELLEGTDLETVLMEGEPLSVRDVVRYVVDACEGVAVAHSAGIVHRDIKPSNLFLAAQPDGKKRVKLLDFGIAKLGADRSQGKRTSVRLVMGTSQYMSPEQIRSSTNVDVRSDVWSLGVVLFELLTRQLPFEASSPAATMHAILHEPPPRFSSMFGDVPEDLMQVVAKCLEKDPAKRFATVRELADALLPFTDTPESYGPLFVLPARDSRPVPPNTQRVPIETIAAEDDEDGDRSATLPESGDAWFSAIAEARRKISG